MIVTSLRPALLEVGNPGRSDFEGYGPQRLRKRSNRAGSQPSAAQARRHRPLLRSKGDWQRSTLPLDGKEIPDVTENLERRAWAPPLTEADPAEAGEVVPGRLRFHLQRRI